MTAHALDSSTSRVRLRQAEPDDLAWMAEMAADRELVGPHNFAGESLDLAEVLRELRDRFEADRLVASDSGTLIVVLEDETPVGHVGWRTERWGPSSRSRCPAIGIALLPQFRGQGLGTSAQRLLVDHLFASEPELHRVQSDTAVDNVAEQRSLAKIGMVEEGRVRDAEFRDGQYHDHTLYSILRSEWEARPKTS